MNVLKHMEAIFLATVVLAGITAYASAAASTMTSAAHARYNAQVAIEGQQMAVVKVSARRLGHAAD
jgi:hypothetical protein